MRQVRNIENKVYHIFQSGFIKIYDMFETWFQYIVYRMNQIEIYVHGIAVSQLSG